MSAPPGVEEVAHWGGRQESLSQLDVSELAREAADDGDRAGEPAGGLGRLAMLDVQLTEEGLSATARLPG